MQAALLITLFILSSTFRIWEWTKLPLGGAVVIRPTDVIILILAIKSLYLLMRQQYDHIDLWIYIIGAWMFLACLFNILTGELSFLEFLYVPSRMITAWLTLPYFRRMPRCDAVNAFWGISIVILVSMAIHLVISLLHRDDLIQQYYYYNITEDGEAAVLIDRQSQLLRGTPGCQLAAIALWASSLYLFFESRITWHMYYCACCCFFLEVALLVNITRSTVLCILIVSILISWIKRNELRAKRRIMWFGVVTALGVIAASFYVSDYIEAYMGRIDTFDKEFASNTIQDNPRVMDSMSVIRAIQDRWMIGTGSPRLKNFDTRTGGDVHVLFRIMLFGGIPLVMFVLIFNLKALSYGWQHRTVVTEVGAIGVLACVLPIMLNAPGASGMSSLQEMMAYIFWIVCATLIDVPVLINREVLQK